MQQRLEKAATDATAQTETAGAEADKLRARIKDLNGELATRKEQIGGQSARIQDLQARVTRAEADLEAAKQAAAPAGALADARARLDAGRTELLRAEAQIQLLRDLLLGGTRP